MARFLWNGGKTALVATVLLAAASVASAGIYTFQDGDANAYDGSRATFVWDNQYATEYMGSSQEVRTENQTTGSSHATGDGIQRALIQFTGLLGSGPTQIGANETVLGARLELHTGGPSGDPQSPNTTSAHQMLRTWDEATAHWTAPGAGPAWGAPGMQAGTDYAATPDDGRQPTNGNAWYSWNVTPTLWNWQSGEPNHGLAMVSNGANRAGFWSDDAATQSLRPRLIGETTAGPIGGTERHLFKDGSGPLGDTDATYILKACDGSWTNTNYGTSDTLLVEQQTTPAIEHYQGIKRTLVRFPDALGAGPGQVPLGSTVVSATLALDCTDPSVGPLYVHRVLENWDELQATYNDRLTGTAWSAAGMGSGTDYEAISWPRRHTAASGSFNEFDVTAIAQAWADGAPNYGVVIRSTTDDGANYSSDDAAAYNRPVLMIDTATPGWGTSVRSATAATCDATYILKGSSGSNYGSLDAFDTDGAPDAERRRALIAFPDLIGTDLNEIPQGSNIVSATLRLHIHNRGQWAGSPGTHSIYQVLTVWDEDAVTWTGFNNGGVAGMDYNATALDSLSPGLTDSFYYFDVTGSVQNWADGQDNFGWILLNSVGDRANWDSDDWDVGVYRPLLVVEWVPEPASLVLLGGGLLALLRRRRGR